MTTINTVDAFETTPYQEFFLKADENGFVYKALVHINNEVLFSVEFTELGQATYEKYEGLTTLLTAYQRDLLTKHFNEGLLNFECRNGLYDMLNDPECYKELMTTQLENGLLLFASDLDELNV